MHRGDGTDPMSLDIGAPEVLIKALRAPAVRDVTIAAAALTAPQIANEIIAVIERARVEELEAADERLLFRGVHILGGRRWPAAYRPLVALLNEPGDRVEELLGDAITETLLRILAGVFDGDPEPLERLVLNAAAAPFVREAALYALTFLCFDRRIERARIESLLQSLEGRLESDEYILWNAWMNVIALLAFDAFVPRVMAAFADGRILPEFTEVREFREMLADARARPNDPERLSGLRLGYIEDTLDELNRFAAYDEFAPDLPASDELLGADDQVDEGFDLQVPARNPFRDIGRNDPCPCGSGKKAKKCCLA